MKILNSEHWKQFKSKFGRYVQDYLVNTSMHGLKYIGDVSLSCTERIFFFVAFVIVSILSAYFISNLWKKWTDTPIIIALNSVSTPLNNIPFPAVTICNMNQAKNSIANNIQDDSLDSQLLQSVCNLEAQLNLNSSSSAAARNEKFIGKWPQFRNFLVNISQPCKEMLKYCRFAMEEENCMDIFLSVLTDEGLCCTFNILHPRYMFYHQNDQWDVNPNEHPKYSPVDWTPEKGFLKSLSSRTYPRRAAGSGAHMGLTIILDANVKSYYCTSTNSLGFKVLLHTPTETPKISNFGFFITPGQEVRAVVDPKINDASNLIRDLPVKLRNCFFASEGNLSYFRTYSKKNCEMECESVLILQHCGCVLFYMPKVNEDIKICSRQDADCYERVRVAIELQNNDSFSCSKCLPGCFEFSFGRELTVANLGNRDKYNLRDEYLSEIPYDYAKDNLAVLHIFFSESSFRSFTKGELIGFTEFLSSTGGLLGLFMGFSVLSLVEILYFVSMRPYWINRKEKLKQKTHSLPAKKDTKTKRKKFPRQMSKIAWIKYDDSGLDGFVPFPYTE